MLRAIAMMGAAALMIGVLLLSGWDYLQVDRKVPTMAAANAQATVILVDKTARKLALLMATC